MHSDIFRFLNKLTPTSENKNEIYNIIIPLILSKKILKNSNELRDFIEEIFEFKIAGYVYKSRTILLGKVIRLLSQLELSESININNKLTKFILKILESNSKSETNVKKKTYNKNNSENLIRDWSNFIRNL